MRIAFFGLPLAAVLLAGDGHDIVYAGACRRAPGWRRLATRIAPGRADLCPDLLNERTLSRVKQGAPDLVVSWFWTQKLPESVLRLAPAFGVHPSLLPRHRGPDPYFWTIDSGDEWTGVTAHLLDVEYDTGGILASRPVRVESDWNSWRLARALDRPSVDLLRDVARRYALGTPPTPTPQDETAATAAPEPSDSDLAIRWMWPASRIERRVRAAAPWPGAWTEIGNRIVTLVAVRTTRDYPRALAPSEAAVRADGVAVVRAGEDAVELIAGRDEADDALLSEKDLAKLLTSARS